MRRARTQNDFLSETPPGVRRQRARVPVLAVRHAQRHGQHEEVIVRHVRAAVCDVARHVHMLPLVLARHASRGDHVLGDAARAAVAQDNVHRRREGAAKRFRPQGQLHGRLVHERQARYGRARDGQQNELRHDHIVYRPRDPRAKNVRRRQFHLLAHQARVAARRRRAVAQQPGYRERDGVLRRRPCRNVWEYAVPARNTCHRARLLERRRVYLAQRYARRERERLGTFYIAVRVQHNLERAALRHDVARQQVVLGRAQRVACPTRARGKLRVGNRVGP